MRSISILKHGIGNTRSIIRIIIMVNISESCDLCTVTKKMSVLSFVQILRGYFLFSTVGFVFINEGA